MKKVLALVSIIYFLQTFSPVKAQSYIEIPFDNNWMNQVRQVIMTGNINGDVFALLKACADSCRFRFDPKDKDLIESAVIVKFEKFLKEEMNNEGVSTKVMHDLRNALDSAAKELNENKMIKGSSLLSLINARNGCSDLEARFKEAKFNL